MAGCLLLDLILAAWSSVSISLAAWRLAASLAASRLCLCRRVLCLARDDAGFLRRGPLVGLRLEAGLLGSDDGGLLRLFLLRLAGR